MKTFIKVAVVCLFAISINACSDQLDEEFESTDVNIEDVESTGGATGKGQRPGGGG